MVVSNMHSACPIKCSREIVFYGISCYMIMFENGDQRMLECSWKMRSSELVQDRHFLVFSQSVTVPQIGFGTQLLGLLHVIFSNVFKISS